jgi:adiponectin receptor
MLPSVRDVRLLPSFQLFLKLKSDSSSFHTIMNHSLKMEKLGMQLDFQGVILLMWSATVPLIYYGFYCDKTLQWVYWSLV